MIKRKEFSKEICSEIKKPNFDSFPTYQKAITEKNTLGKKLR